MTLSPLHVSPPASRPADTEPTPQARTLTGRAASTGSLLCAAAAALPLILLLVSLVVGGGPATESADAALLTLGARDALHGGVLVGPYSRFGWHHPGPSYFYLLAVPTWLWSGPTGTWIAATAIGCASVVATILLVRKGAGARAGWWAAAGALFVVVGVGPVVFRDPWNPYVVALPVLLSVVASALGGAGVPGALAWSAVAGSFAVQTHVSTAPVVVGVLAAAVLVRAVGWLARRRHRSVRPTTTARQVGPYRPWWRRRSDLIVATVLLVAAWAPPLWDEAFGTGNLSSLVTFFTSPHVGHPWGESWRLVTAVVGITAFQHHSAFHDGVADPHPLLTTLAFVGVAALAIGVGVARRRPLAVWLGGAGLLAGALAVESVTRVVGLPYRYLLLWMAVLPVLPALGAVVALEGVHLGGGASHRRPARWWVTPGAALTALVVVTCSVLGLRAVARTPPAVDSTDRDIQTAYRLVAPAVGPGKEAVHIEINDRWPAAAGVALELARRGHPIRVDRPWTLLFGDGRLSHGTEPVVIVVAGLDPKTWPPPDQATRLGRAGPEILFVRRVSALCRTGGSHCP